MRTTENSSALLKRFIELKWEGFDGDIPFSTECFKSFILCVMSGMVLCIFFQLLQEEDSLIVV